MLPRPHGFCEIQDGSTNKTNMTGLQTPSRLFQTGFSDCCVVETLGTGLQPPSRLGLNNPFVASLSKGLLRPTFK